MMPSQAIALPPPVQHPAHRRRGGAVAAASPSPAAGGSSVEPERAPRATTGWPTCTEPDCPIFDRGQVEGRIDFQHRQVGEAIPPPAASAGTPRDLFVQAVAPDGAAAAAGIQAGDVITKADGADATSSLPLQALSLTKSPGDAVGIEHWRDGHTATATVTLGSASQT